MDTLREKDSEFYQVKVTLTSDRLKQDKPVYPGLTAEINILTGKISILHALLKPFWNIQGNALLIGLVERSRKRQKIKLTLWFAIQISRLAAVVAVCYLNHFLR